MMKAARRSRSSYFGWMLRSISTLEIALQPVVPQRSFQSTSNTLLNSPSLPCALWKRSYSQDIQADAPPITELQFHKAADITLEDIYERIEAFVEALDLDDSDVEYSQGVLTIKLGALGTYVINKQTPNKQLWMSSPVSGPVRYDYAPAGWVYKRDGHKMHERLEKEFEELTGGALDLNPCVNCDKLGTCVEGNHCLAQDFIVHKT